MAKKQSHKITKNPCETCGGHPRNHYATHQFKEGCCILKEEQHYPDKRKGRERTDTRVGENRRPYVHKDREFWFIDGEGHNRHPKTNAPSSIEHYVKHRYVMLSAASENMMTGKESDKKPPRIVNRFGLSSKECFDFVIDNIPRHTRVFSFGFNYDTTMMIKDLPNRAIYRLLRPSLRSYMRFDKKSKKKIPTNAPEYYAPEGKIEGVQGYALNHMGSEISIQRGLWTYDARKQDMILRCTIPAVRIYDIFKFFQRPFVEALASWFADKENKLPPEVQVTLKAMKVMKDKRSSPEWDALEEATADYNDDECVLGAQLARKLQTASEDAGYALTRRYDSSGTLAKIAMRKHGIIEENRHPSPEMRRAVAQAAFGGRFENSVIGLIEGEVLGKDLSGAYNHSCAILPCLKCGVWELTKVRERLDDSDVATALVRYRYSEPPKDISWGPLPHRFENQLICFPACSGGGWIWLPEFRLAEKGWNHVHFMEAWILRSSCGHYPFSWVAKLYNERLKLSKEGKGIVFKNVANSVPGSLMQTIGSGIFHNSIWAGLLTSETRSRILEVILTHNERWNLLSVATDGIVTKEHITLPPAFDTDFMLDEDARKNKTPEQLKKPLGGWEDKESGPTFFIRPGQSIPWLAEGITKEKEQFVLKILRSRGISRELMVKHGDAIIQTFFASLQGKKLDGTPLDEGSAGQYQLPEDKRFIPAKLAVMCKRRPKDSIMSAEGSDNLVYTRSETYGQWVNRPRVINFDPRPKREFEMQIQEGSRYARLRLRKLPMDLECAPYDKYLAFDEKRDSPGKTSPEAIRGNVERDLIMGQPDLPDFDFAALDLVEMEL
jgi:hypothetical protein